MKVFTLAAATTLLATAAIAQTSTTSPTAPTNPPAQGTMGNSGATGTSGAPSTMGSSGMASPGGMNMASGGMNTVTTSTMAVRYMSVAPTDTVTSNLRGADVVNKDNEKLGDVEDFVIKDGKTISGVILSVGGFLGMGERYVAVEPSALTLVRDGNTFKAVMNTTKDDLNNAPKFEYKRNPG